MASSTKGPGPDTKLIAAALYAFEPDDIWALVED
jgi:hypothetical protein